MKKEQSIIDIAWDTYATQIKEAIAQGFLDDEIRKIARACFDRRDVIKDAEQLHGDRDPQERNVLPKNPVEVDVPPARGNSADVDEGGGPYSEPSKARGTNAKTGSVPKSKPKRAGRPVVSKTFEYAGRIYNAAEVRGRIFQYQETGAGGKRYWGKITGCGPRSIKVTWVHDSSGTACPDDHVGCCPVKYRDPKAKDGRKVTFMGHSYIEPILNSIKPLANVS